MEERLEMEEKFSLKNLIPKTNVVVEILPKVSMFSINKSLLIILFLK